MHLQFRSSLVAPSLVVFFLSVLYLSQFVYAYSSGWGGSTNKPGMTSPGCGCHSGANPNPATHVSFSTDATQFEAGKSYTFRISVSHDSLLMAGVNVAVFDTLALLTPGTGLKRSTKDLVHTAPKTLVNGTATWEFTYKAGTIAGWDTLYAVGNAVNGISSGGDAWNFAEKFVIEVKPASRVAYRIDLADGFRLRSSIVDEEFGLSYRMHKPSDVTLEIVNSTGNVVLRHVDRGSVGTRQAVLRTNTLANGHHYLRVVSPEGRLFDAKLLVKH